MGLAMPRLVLRGSHMPGRWWGRLEEGGTSEVTVERNERNLRTSTLNVMVSGSRVSGGWVSDGEESRTWP